MRDILKLMDPAQLLIHCRWVDSQQWLCDGYEEGMMTRGEVDVVMRRVGRILMSEYAGESDATIIALMRQQVEDLPLMTGDEQTTHEELIETLWKSFDSGGGK